MMMLRIGNNIDNSVERIAYSVEGRLNSVERIADSVECQAKIGKLSAKKWPAPLQNITVKKKSSVMGFTLIEVLVAVAVLSLGLVMVYQVFFTALDSFNYSANYLEIAPWMDEKIWQVQDHVLRAGVMDVNPEEGEIIIRNKKFNWLLSPGVLDPGANLSVINLAVSWREGKRNVSVSRAGYVKYE